jgi:hypothetical protein
MMPRPLSGLVFAVAAMTLPVAISPLRAQTSTADTSFQVPPDAVIEITMRNGRLTVRGEDRRTAEIRANRINYELRSSKVGVTLDVNDGNHDHDNRSSRNNRNNRNNNRNDESDVVLIVPRAVRLVINGRSSDVSVSNVNGDVEATLLNGDFEARALGGRAIIETLTGDVKITEGVGDLRVTTASGDVVATGVRGSVEAGATTGSITIAGDRLGRVKAGVVSGDIDITGALGDDSRLQLSAHSGDVIVRLPEAAAGQLEATTYTGSIRGGTMTMMPPVARSFNDRGNARLYEFGGGGNARISATTFSGDITIQRGARPRRDE